MKNFFVSAVALCLACLYGPCPAAASSTNYHFIVLTPGHSQTMYFELDNSILNSSSEFHTFYCLTVGAGTLNIRVGPSSSVGQFAGMIYGVVGLFNLTPIAQYGYNAETVTVNVTAPVFGAGIVLTAITSAYGNPDYPIVMGMVASLIQ